MTNEELLENIQENLAVLKSQLDIVIENMEEYGEDFEEQKGSYEYEIDWNESLVKIISATIPRETAKIKPTEANADTFDGMGGMIIAKTKRGPSVVKAWWIVANNPDGYPKWISIPKMYSMPESPVTEVE